MRKGESGDLTVSEILFSLVALTFAWVRTMSESLYKEYTLSLDLVTDSFLDEPESGSDSDRFDR